MSAVDDLSKVAAREQSAFDKGVRASEEVARRMQIDADLEYAVSFGVISRAYREELRGKYDAPGVEKTLELVQRCKEARAEEQRAEREEARKALEAERTEARKGLRVKLDRAVNAGVIAEVFRDQVMAEFDLQYLEDHRDFERFIGSALERAEDRKPQFEDQTRDGASIFDGALVENEKGGRQSKTPGAFYMLPARGIRAFLNGRDLSSERDRLVGEDYLGSLDLTWYHLCNLLGDDGDGREVLSEAIYALSREIEAIEGPIDGLTPASPGYRGLLRCAQVMEGGASKYGRGNWRRIEYWSEIDHAIQHLIAFEMGDKAAYKPMYGPMQDETICNLWNALCRLIFAAEVYDPDYRFTAIEDPHEIIKTHHKHPAGYTVASSTAEDAVAEDDTELIEHLGDEEFGKLLKLTKREFDRRCDQAFVSGKPLPTFDL